MNKIIETIQDYDKGQAFNDGLYWYNFDKISKYGHDCPLWMIYGQRRIGKTHAATWLAFEIFKRYGFQTAWVRNYKVEFQDPQFRASFMNAPLRFGWITEDWTIGDDGVRDPDGNLAIMFCSLSTAGNMRGNEWPNIHFIYLDEAQREDRKVVKRAHTMFLSLIQTLISGKPDSLAIITSNRVSATDQMLVGLGVYPSPKYSVTRHADKGIVIESCRVGDYHKAIDHNDPFNKVFQAGRYGDYADDSEDDMVKLVKAVPKGGKKSHWVYKIDGQYYTSWQSGGLYYFDEYKGKISPNDTVCTPNVQELETGVIMVDSFLRRKLTLMIDNGLVRFASPNVMLPIINMVYKIAV